MQVNIKKKKKVTKKLLNERFKDSTVVIVTHRVDSVIDCDQVIVLSKGQIVETGTPSQLLAKNGVFTELLYS